ncbi:MAG: thioredoxin family protein [Planctomycetota bacterium]
MRACLFIVGMVLLVACSSTEQQTASPGQSPEQSPAPSETATDQTKHMPGISNGLPRLVDLGATSCMPCKMMAPILEELEREYEGRMEVIFIDVWENREAGKAYGISTIPTQILYDAEGRERWRHVGFIGKEDILAAVAEAGVELAAADE